MKYLVADLLNNARRRLDEGKADDAVARLFWCVELMAQHILHAGYNVETSNVDLSILKARGLEDEVVQKYACS